MGTYLEAMRLDLKQEEIYLIWAGLDAHRKATGPYKCSIHLGSQKKGKTESRFTYTLTIPKGEWFVKRKTKTMKHAPTFKNVLYFSDSRQKEFFIHSYGGGNPKSIHHRCVMVERSISSNIFNKCKSEKNQTYNYLKSEMNKYFLTTNQR